MYCAIAYPAQLIRVLRLTATSALLLDSGAMRQYERGPANPTPRKCDWLSQPALELNQKQKATFWKRIGDLVGDISYLGD